MKVLIINEPLNYAVDFEVEDVVEAVHKCTEVENAHKGSPWHKHFYWKRITNDVQS